MLIHAFPSGPLETNAYVVACKRTKAAAIIDPAPNSLRSLAPFISQQQLNPIALLLTHSHWDHIGDAAVVKSTYNLPLFIHAEDAKNLEFPGSDGLPCWLNIPSVSVTHFLKEHDVIPIGDLNFKVIFTPGHTPGGVCFYCAQQNVLISGDTLFKGSIGNLSFTTGRPSLMWASLAKLASLPPITRVFPGHGEETTIGQEKWLARAEEIYGN